MLTKEARDFILHITNYFDGHWEDPDWGRRPENQLLVGLAIRALSSGIAEARNREQIHGAANEVVAKNAQLVAKG
jgi:hypothetical protein